MQLEDSLNSASSLPGTAPSASVPSSLTPETTPESSTGKKKRGRPLGSRAQSIEPSKISEIEGSSPTYSGGTGSTLPPKSTPTPPPVYLSSTDIAQLIKTGRFIAPMLSKKIAPYAKRLSDKRCAIIGEVWAPVLPVLFPTGTGKYTPVIGALIATTVIFSEIATEVREEELKKTISGENK